MNDYTCSMSGLRALEWQSEQFDNKSSMVCLHGWLDNAESFRLLAEKSHASVLAVDLPGHGQSKWKPEGAEYAIWNYTQEIQLFLKQLEAPVHLVGHSLGGAVAIFVAAAFPELVKSLVLLDSIGPLVTAEGQVAKQLRKSIERSQIAKPARSFDELDHAIAARRKATAYMSDEAIALLVKRNLVTNNENQYQWGWDPRLRLESQVRMTEAQVQGLCGAVECPVLGIRAESGLIPESFYQQRAGYFKNIRVVPVSGHHHFHMESNSVNRILDLIEEFQKGL